MSSFCLNVILIWTFFFILRESDITKERIQKILASGANVILTTGGIDDMCLKYFVDVGAMAVRRVLKRDLKRIAKATGGTLMFVGTEFVSHLFLVMKTVELLLYEVQENCKLVFVNLPATVCPSLTNLEGEETFEATMLGQAEEVAQERVCDDELILVKK